MKAEEYRERKVDVAGWQVNLASYRIENTWHCKADNVSPGACLTRSTGQTREEAEDLALRRAGDLLGRTKRHDVSPNA